MEQAEGTAFQKRIDASASSSPSATVIGLSTGDGPITIVTNTAVDLTVPEFADTVGKTENIEYLQSRMDNQEYSHYDPHGYEHDYDQGPPDDLGVSVAMAIAQNRRTQNRLPLTKIFLRKSY